MHSEKEVHVINITEVWARHDGVLQQIADCENMALPLEVNAANAQLFAKASETKEALRLLLYAINSPDTPARDANIAMFAKAASELA
jgi:hypothetical protein